MSVEELEKVPVEGDGDPYQQVYDVLELSDLLCGPFVWKLFKDFNPENVGQPAGLNLTNLLKNSPILECIKDIEKKERPYKYIIPFGIHPGYYEITENLKMKRPLINLELIQEEWSISVVGKLISCGKVYSDEVIVWYDEKSKSTQMRMNTKQDISLPVGCLLPSARPDHSRHSMLTRYVKPSNDTTLEVIFKDNQTLTNYQDKQLKFNSNGKVHLLEESLIVSNGFWIGKTVIPDNVSKDILNVIYPELTKFSNFFVDCVDFSKVFYLSLIHI